MAFQMAMRVQVMIDVRINAFCLHEHSAGKQKTKTTTNSLRALEREREKVNDWMYALIVLWICNRIRHTVEFQKAEKYQQNDE